jgi:hypothetical protein
MGRESTIKGAEIRHWSRRDFLVGTVGCLLAACYQGQTGELGYSIATSGEGNQVSISQETDAYTVTIHSTQGIGQASIAWWGNLMPHHLNFQLHLGSLEQFTLGWDEQRVSVQINSSNQAVIEILQPHQGAETPIAFDSPYWMDVTLPTSSVQVYSLRAPSAFIAAAPKVWAIAWIDFYRS